MQNVPATYLLHGRSRGGSVSVMFAGMAIPLVICAGLAVDYSFYVQAQSQLITAADAGALHAVRIAAADFVAGQTVAQSITAGTSAGQQWFAAQVGSISDATVQTVNVPPVQYNASNGTFTETVTYQGKVPTHLAGFVTRIPSWPVQGTSSASITANSYAGFYFLIDNSSSMLIGATQSDIIKMEGLTMCAPTATAQAAAQTMSAYSWSYPSPYGYGWYEQIANNNQSWIAQTQPPLLPPGTQLGSCDPNFSGGSAQCPYAPSLTAYNSVVPILDLAGYCPAGTGIPDQGYQANATANIVKPRVDLTTLKTANIPQAPCGFACHTGDGVHDYYTTVRNSGQNIMLRFDVIQAAAANVMNLLIARQQDTQINNQFAVGVYQFNSAVTQVHPSPGNAFVESDSNLTGAQADITNIATPVVGDAPNTDFPDAISYLAANLQPAGSGGTPATRTKNMFIITDGLEDDNINGRYIGPMTAAPPATEQTCSKLKALGYNIYVLYTPYYPLPNPFYLNNGPRSNVEPTVPPATSNPDIAALQACASSPNQFYQASDSASINLALQNAVQSALASPGRLTN